MSDKVKVEKINIKIGDVEVALSVESAKELQKILNELFGNKEFIYVSNPPTIWIYPYTAPFVTTPYRWWQPTITWYNSGTGTTGTGVTISYINS